MKVSNELKRQIIIEIFALIFLIFVIIYAIFAINKSYNSNVTNQDGMILVIDDTEFSNLEVLSDGNGLNTKGIKYTVTNNNSKDVTYNIIIIPSIKDNEVLDNIRISIDDIYIENLTDLEKRDDGYIITTHTLKSGYTKIHKIKLWYKLKTDKENIEDIKFTFDFEKIE